MKRAKSTSERGRLLFASAVYQPISLFVMGNMLN
jgi:hypothetical protein